MASLYQRDNGYYYLSFFRADRRPTRKQISTGARTKREAERVQRALEEGFESGAFDPWRDDPRAFLRGEPAGGGYDSFGEAVAAFLATRANLSPTTREWYRSHLEAAAAGVGEGTPVAQVSTRALQRYLDGKGVRAVTKHGCRRALRALFRRLLASGSRPSRKNVSTPVDS